jgi:hypothetical protein
MDFAPKDGKEIMIYAHHRILIVKWSWRFRNWILTSDPTPEENDKWYGIGASVPTHWMPLPEAPTEEE